MLVTTWLRLKEPNMRKVRMLVAHLLELLALSHYNPRSICSWQLLSLEAYEVVSDATIFRIGVGIVFPKAYKPNNPNNIYPAACCIAFRSVRSILCSRVSKRIAQLSKRCCLGARLLAGCLDGWVVDVSLSMIPIRNTWTNRFSIDIANSKCTSSNHANFRIRFK